MKMTPKMKNDQKTPILDSVFKIVILGPFGILDLIFIYILTPNSLESVLKSSNCDLQDESYVDESPVVEKFKMVKARHHF